MAVLNAIQNMEHLKKKYFFDEDNDGHWYIIPVEKRKLWSELLNEDTGSENWYERWQAADFDSCRTNGGISNIEFSIDE